MELFVTPSTVVDITHLILTSIILFYFWLRRKESQSTRTMFYLFIAVWFFLLSATLFETITFTFILWVIPFQYICAAIMMVFLIKYSYTFPSADSWTAKEAVILNVVSIAVVVMETGLSIHLIVGAIGPYPVYSNEFLWMSLLLLLEFIWAILVLIRRTVKSEAAESPAERIRALTRPVHPQSHATRAAALVVAIPTLTALMVFLRDSGIIPVAFANLMIPLGITLFFFAFVLIYLNHSRESGSFVVKLVAASLTIILVMLGAIGHLVFPFWDENYRNQHLPSESQTIRFTPNTGGKGYYIQSLPSQFDNRFRGHKRTRLKYQRSQNTGLPFSFPFAGNDYQDIYLTGTGMITFGSSIHPMSAWASYQHAISPAWFLPAWRDKQSESNDKSNDNSNISGVYFGGNQEKFTITWFRILEYKTGKRNTVQLSLFPDGAIEFSYLDIQGSRPQMAGVFSGEGHSAGETIRFARHLPVSTSSNTVMENYHRDYRLYLHKRLLPLLYIILISTVVILAVLPLILRNNLSKPLKELLNGFSEVRRGRLSVSVPVRFKDEIGSLSESFNHMVRTLENTTRHNLAILDTAAEGILTLDSNGIIQSGNQAAHDMFGYVRDELNGKPDYILLEQDSRRKDQPPGFLAHYKAAGNKKRFGVDHLFRGKRKDGSLFPLEFAVNISQSSDDPFYTVALHDLTEHRHLAEEKQKLEDQLHQSQKLETIGTLAGGVAHDFNNILTPIIGYTEMSLDELAALPEIRTVTSPLRSYLENILQSCTRAKDLVKQILTFSRRSETVFEIVEIHPLIKGAITFLRASTPSSIEFKLDLSAQSGTVFGDRTQLEQVLLNLCTNATQAMLPGGGDLSIRLEPVVVDKLLAARHPGLHQDHYVVLEVSDAGKGIHPNTLEHIFEPFYTTKPVGQGTGLGLSVVHGIVEKHGGVIMVDSQLGVGSTFQVYFPAIKDALEEKAAVEYEDTFSGEASILFVDDEPMISDMYKNALERAGYQVTAETSSLRTLELFRRRPDDFDLIITDHTMPELSGIQLAGEILALKPGMPIILWTGNIDAISLESCKKMGIGKILMKPLFFSTLNRCIHELLEKRGPRHG